MGYQLRNKQNGYGFDCGETLPKLKQGVWECGSFRVTDQFGNDYEVVEPAGPDITVSPVEFKLLWTSAERIAARAQQETDTVIADFFDIVDDSRLTFVNLSLGSTKDGVDYLLSKLVEIGVVAGEDVPARRAAILSGQFV